MSLSSSEVKFRFGKSDFDFIKIRVAATTIKLEISEGSSSPNFLHNSNNLRLPAPTINH